MKPSKVFKTINISYAQTLTQFVAQLILAFIVVSPGAKLSAAQGISTLLHCCNLHLSTNTSLKFTCCVKHRYEVLFRLIRLIIMNR